MHYHPSLLFVAAAFASGAASTLVRRQESTEPKRMVAVLEDGTREPVFITNKREDLAEFSPTPFSTYFITVEKEVDGPPPTCLPTFVVDQEGLLLNNEQGSAVSVSLEDPGLFSVSKRRLESLSPRPSWVVLPDGFLEFSDGAATAESTKSTFSIQFDTGDSGPVPREPGFKSVKLRLEPKGDPDACTGTNPSIPARPVEASNTTDPVNTANDPDVSANDPDVSVNDPDVSANEPNGRSGCLSGRRLRA